MIPSILSAKPEDSILSVSIGGGNCTSPEIIKKQSPKAVTKLIIKVTICSNKRSRFKVNKAISINCSILQCEKQNFHKSTVLIMNIK